MHDSSLLRPARAARCPLKGYCSLILLRVKLVGVSVMPYTFRIML